MEGDERHEGERRESDVESEQAADAEMPSVEAEPGVTAPVDELTEEERRLEPAGVMPGGGPDDATETAGVEETKEKPEGVDEDGSDREA